MPESTNKLALIGSHLKQPKVALSTTWVVSASYAYLALLMVHVIPLQLTSSDDGSVHLLEVTGSV